jgi:hypothetical protein
MARRLGTGKGARTPDIKTRAGQWRRIRRPGIGYVGGGELGFVRRVQRGDALAGQEI